MEGIRDIFSARRRLICQPNQLSMYESEGTIECFDPKTLLCAYPDSEVIGALSKGL